MFSKKIKTVVSIEGMSCEHCANKVKKELEKIDNVKKVKVDLIKKQATILSEKSLDEKQLKETIESLEYQYCGIVGVSN
jgi:copper chaperone CopZ